MNLTAEFLPKHRDWTSGPRRTRNGCCQHARMNGEPMTYEALAAVGIEPNAWSGCGATGPIDSQRFTCPFQRDLWLAPGYAMDVCASSWRGECVWLPERPPKRPKVKAPQPVRVFALSLPERRKWADVMGRRIWARLQEIKKTGADVSRELGRQDDWVSHAIRHQYPKSIAQIAEHLGLAA